MTTGWQIATVEAVKTETDRAKTFVLSAPGISRFRPGQHIDIRLTAPDGYQAQRSYSIASPPEDSGVLEVTVELIEDGEVSPYFHEVVRAGDQFEIRGPIGGPFTWQSTEGGPLLLIAGGSGIVPLMSMLRHRSASSAFNIPVLLLYSSRSLDDVIYREELESMAAQDDHLQVDFTLTRQRPDGWSGYERRVDDEMLGEVIEKLGAPRLSYVCGPTAFVESVASALVERGLEADSIRTERFGPSGT